MALIVATTGDFCVWPIPLKKAAVAAQECQ